MLAWTAGFLLGSLFVLAALGLAGWLVIKWLGKIGESWF